MKYFQLLLFSFVLFSFIGCGQTTREVRIKSFGLLSITDMATDNTKPTNGSNFMSSGEVPIFPGTLGSSNIPIEVNFSQGGILSANKFLIEGSTNSVIIIERAVSGNHNTPVVNSLQKIMRPVDHPFGNIQIEDGNVKREHVENQYDQ